MPVPVQLSLLRELLVLAQLQTGTSAPLDYRQTVVKVQYNRFPQRHDAISDSTTLAQSQQHTRQQQFQFHDGYHR